MIPAAVANSWFFWLVIIDGLAAIYILPTVIAIARQVESLGLVICLNVIPVAWPAALLLACLMPRKEISPCSVPAVAARAIAEADAVDGTEITETITCMLCRVSPDELAGSWCHYLRSRP